MVGRLRGRSPVPRARCGRIFAFKDRIERMADAATRRYAANHADPTAITDARTVPLPHRPKRAKEFKAVPAYPEIRSLYHPAGLHVRAGNEPASASVGCNDRLSMVSKIGDVFKRKCSRRSRRKRQRLRDVGPDDIDEEYAGAGFRRLVDRLVVADGNRHCALAVFRKIAAIGTVGYFSKTGPVRLYRKNISVVKGCDTLMTARKSQLAAVGTPGQLVYPKPCMRIGVCPQATVVRTVGLDGSYLRRAAHIGDTSGRVGGWTFVRRSCVSRRVHRRLRAHGSR